MTLDLTCPCDDGLPDPCTVCGVGANDGACELDRVNTERQSVAYERGRADAFAEHATLVAAARMAVDSWDDFSAFGRPNFERLSDALRSVEAMT